MIARRKLETVQIFGIKQQTSKCQREVILKRMKIKIKHENLWDATETVLTGKLIAVSNK